MRVLGVDASTRCSGIVLIPAGAVTETDIDWNMVEAWTLDSIKVKNDGTENKRVVRLASLASEFEAILEEADPTHVVFEQYAPGAARFAHSKVTAEITGMMKLLSYRYGAHVNSVAIGTARKAFLDAVLPRKGSEAKAMVQLHLIAKGAPKTITASLDVCEAIVAADHEMGSHGFVRIGEGPLAGTPKTKKARAKAAMEKPVVPPFRVGQYTVEVYLNRVESYPSGFASEAVASWLNPSEPKCLSSIPVHTDGNTVIACYGRGVFQRPMAEIVELAFRQSGDSIKIGLATVSIDALFYAIRTWKIAGGRNE